MWHRVLEHHAVQVGIGEGERTVPDLGVAQPVEHVRLIVGFHGRPQPIEAPGQHCFDQAVFAPEVVVHAHRGDAGLGGDRANGESAGSFPGQYRLRRDQQFPLDVRAACARSAALDGSRLVHAGHLPLGRHCQAPGLRP
jgi:hypothetical protein